jgi:predicted membrane protein
MNEETIDKEPSVRRRRFGRGGNRVLTGVFLLVIGALLMAKTAGVFFPSWFFTWPMILIAVGIYSAFQHRFKGGAWMLFLLVGSIFLADKISDNFYLRPYFWPIILISTGIFFILRPKSYGCQGRKKGNIKDTDEYNYSLLHDGTGTEKGPTDAMNNFFDVTAIFGGIKRNILSKNFKGGDVLAFMGGAEINLTQADFTGRVMIDSFNMFGGTKLIIPPDWDVQSDVVTIFGGVDDKRPPATKHDTSKLIILDGTCLFGGIEIRSY